MTKTVLQKIPAKTLEWGKISEKKLTWIEAKEWCEQQGDGWRLPTRLELLEAYEANVGGFKAGGSYWSSTEVTAVIAWYVCFSYGYAASYSKTGTYCVRCVKVCDTAKKLK